MSKIEDDLVELQTRLRHWDGFVKALDVPAELTPVFATGRMELLKVATARAMTAEEVQVLYELIGGLLETNAALRQHSQLVAQLTLTMQQSLKGALNSVRRMDDFANFREPV